MTTPHPVGYVYLIRNQVTGYLYVGITKQKIETRFHAHMELCRKRYYGSIPLMCEHYHSYGRESFSVELIENVYNFDDMGEIEGYWIEKLKQKHHLYNRRPYSGYGVWDTIKAER